MNLLQLFLLVLEHGQLGCDIWNSETPKLRLQVKKEHGETCDHGMRSLKLKTAAWLSISRIQIIFCRCPDTSKTQLHMLPFFHFPETPTLKLLIRRGVCYTMCYVKTDSLDLITHTHKGTVCSCVVLKAFAAAAAANGMLLFHAMLTSPAQCSSRQRR